MTTRHTDLLPCPFCGCPAECIGAEKHMSSQDEYWVECKNPDCNSHYDTCEQAAAAWNQRAGPSSASLVESMEKEIIRLRNELEFERAAHTKAMDHLLLELDEARALIYKGYEDISRMKMLLSKKDEAFLGLLAAAEKRGRENERLRCLEIADPKQKPCDCAEKRTTPDGTVYWDIGCSCGNYDDRERIGDWCARELICAAIQGER